jgi:hypothetical protein
VSVPAGSEQFAADSDTSGAANAAPPALAKPFRYEVGVYGTYGMAELSGKMAAGSMQPAAPAPGVGVDFSWCFAPRWGVAVGVEAAFPAVLLSSTGIEAAAAGAALSLRKRATRVDAVYLRVPLWLRFCTPAQRHRFYAALGASLDLTLSGRYRTEETTRTGSDIQTGVTSGSLPFGHGASLAAEAGWRWSLARRWGLYAGAYAAYGLSDIALYGHDTLQDVESISLLLVGVKVKIMINN